MSPILFGAQVSSERLAFLLSTSIPAMLAIWSLLAETRDLARLIESSRGAGCNKANIPLELVTEFSPIVSRAAGEGAHSAYAWLAAEVRCIYCDYSLPCSAPLPRRIVGTEFVLVLIQGALGINGTLFACGIDKYRA